MNQQTITLPSGVTVHIKVEEARPLEAWTEVEIHEQIESLRIERRKVQYRKDEEAVHVRATATEEAKRLRSELSRRKREDVECPACGGVGTHGNSPDGERLYCDGCEYGLGLHKEAILTEGSGVQEWLSTYGDYTYYAAERLGRERRLEELIAAHADLTAKLDLLRAR